MNNDKYIVDFELAEDTKDLVLNNEDADCISDEVKNKLFALGDSTLIKVKSTINSPITIVDVEEVTEESLS